MYSIKRGKVPTAAWMKELEIHGLSIHPITATAAAAAAAAVLPVLRVQVLALRVQVSANLQKQAVTLQKKKADLRGLICYRLQMKSHVLHSLVLIQPRHCLQTLNQALHLDINPDLAVE